MRFLEKVGFLYSYWSGQPSPIRSAIAYFLAKCGVSSWLSYNRNGFRIRMRSAGLASLLWTDPNRSLDGELFLSQFLRPGDLFLDVGANIGVLALQASKIVGPTGHVLAIEAHPRTYDALLHNITLNNLTNIEAVHCAVGRDCGIVQMSDRIDDDWNRIEVTNGAIDVELRTLDGVCLKVEKVDVLKIDVEGFELPVLEGARELLTRTKCLLLECWEAHTKAYGYCAKDIILFLEQKSFVGFLLHEVGQDVRLTSISSEHSYKELENYVFVRDVSILSRWVGIPENEIK